MVRIDYGQVPVCSPPQKQMKYKYRYYNSAINFNYKKWIDGKYLNRQHNRKLTHGSKALVGQKQNTGGWVVIKIAEVF